MSVIDALVVGLGNPGREYVRTRHNVGEEVVRLLAERSGSVLKATRDRALAADVRLGDRRVVLAFPTTYMNDSGIAVRALMRRHGLVAPDGPVPGSLVVVHDELDLEPGVVKIKVGGGLAGNNGLRSIANHLHTQDFVRVRIGIGKPPSKERGAAHVLSRIPAADRELLDIAVQRAADAVEAIVSDGADVAMRTFHAP